MKKVLLFCLICVAISQVESSTPVPDPCSSLNNLLCFTMRGCTWTAEGCQFSQAVFDQDDEPPPPPPSNTCSTHTHLVSCFSERGCNWTTDSSTGNSVCQFNQSMFDQGEEAPPPPPPSTTEAPPTTQNITVYNNCTQLKHFYQEQSCCGNNNKQLSVTVNDANVTKLQEENNSLRYQLHLCEARPGCAPPKSCDSIEAQNCKNWCFDSKCYNHCTFTAISADIGNPGCMTARTTEGAWGCTGWKCECFRLCDRCIEYMHCATCDQLSGKGPDTMCLPSNGT